MTEELKTKIEVLTVSDDETHGSFGIAPLERGYGMTLGNSLRRVLLSSLPGAAVTKVRIEGILHELSKVDGVVEDVPEIILNIKEIAVKSFSDEPVTITLDVEGPKEVTAADIKLDSEVEIANPNLHLATIDEGGSLRIEMIVEKGKGYRVSEFNKSEEDPLDLLAVDSSFTPVTMANFEVKNTRVGQITDYDHLTLDVVTNGTMTAPEAIAQGAEILIDYLELFRELPELDVRDDLENSAEKEDYQRLLDTNIEDLDLSLRSFNCLKRADMHTVGDITSKTLEEMSKIKNFGKKSLQEVQQKIEELGLDFDQPTEDEEE